MPVYESICPKCGKYHVYRTTINERDKTPICNRCEVKTDRKLSAPMGYVDTPAAKR